MTFILASGSASRQRVLTVAGVPFTVVRPDIDEDSLKDDLLARGTDLPDIATILADVKTLRVAQLHRDAVVLGADQTLLFEGELVSKCPNLESAHSLLMRLRGKTHQLVSALTLARNGEAVWRHQAKSTLTMRDFSDGFLDAYLSTEGDGILGCVGCYKLEGLGAQLFEKVEGDYFSILGLPLQPLLAELRRQGVIAT